MTEDKLDKILATVTAMQKKMGGLGSDVSEVKNDVSEVRSRVAGIDGKIITLEDKLNTDMATKQDISIMEDRLLTHIDGFIKLHETLDTELVSLRHKYDRLDGRLKTVETKLGIQAG